MPALPGRASASRQPFGALYRQRMLSPVGSKSTTPVGATASTWPCVLVRRTSGRKSTLRFHARIPVSASRATAWSHRLAPFA